MAVTLMGNPSGFLDWFGVVCSSWISMARSSTRRSYVVPHGHVEYRSVSDGNIMAARFFGLRCGCVVIVSSRLSCHEYDY